MIARLDVVDRRPDRLDDAGRLVAEHGGARVRVLALHEVQVAVAQPGGDGADEHLARTGFVDVDVLDVELTGDAC